jgi:dienelactone hydrolase
MYRTIHFFEEIFQMRFALLLVLILSVVGAEAGVVGKPVEYTAGGITLKGYMAYDDSQAGKRPGILVVHEWWGQNEYARKRAEMLAELGYVALAVDMYGDGKQANHPEDAGKFATEVMKNMPAMKARFMAALSLLKKNSLVDSKQIAAVGYCFGGGVVLAMAREGLDVKGVVSFHGSLATITPAAKGKVKAKILVCHGADDPFVTSEDVNEFKSEMKAANASLKFIAYAGAIHSFTNPGATELGKKFGLPLAYNEKADADSWRDMQEFFKTVFGK